MHFFLKRILAIAAKFTSASAVQSVLDRLIILVQYLQGVGSGANVEADANGERVALKRIVRQAHGRSLCIFDVGANRGQYLTMALNCLNGVDYEIHCFEPARATFAMLAECARGNSKIFPNNCDLGAERGELKLFYDQPGSRLASLTKRKLEHFGMEMTLSENVKVETIDQYCHDRNIQHIDLLKIDVEGHELDVLTGARGMLESSAISMISFEFGGCNIDTRTFVQDFYYFFRQYGFRMARVTPSGRIIELGRYREVYEQFRTTNFLCFHPDCRLA